MLCLHLIIDSKYNMQIDQKKIFPIMGEWLDSHNSIKLDFSNQNAGFVKSLTYNQPRISMIMFLVF